MALFSLSHLANTSQEGVAPSDKVNAPVAPGDSFVCPAWLAQKNKGYNLATSPFSDLMRSQFDVNVSASPRQ